VTSSGKTEIYIKLIEEYLITGKQVLYLLPEIAYYSTGWEAKSLFGNRVAVFHSKYSSNERVEVWKQVLRNSKAQIVIGRGQHYFAIR
jgi:primosomal protein N' (replication factor Y)